MVNHLFPSTKINFDSAVYFQDSLKMIFYRGGRPWYYKYWLHSGNTLGCCGKTILLDYNKLNCNGDSALISNIKQSKDSVVIHQFCKETIVKNDILGELKCIRTLQKNYREGVVVLRINRYYSRNIGLVYNQQEGFNASGMATYTETKDLASFKTP